MVLIDASVKIYNEMATFGSAGGEREEMRRVSPVLRHRVAVSLGFGVTS